jgi:hypothetical protein
MHGAQGIQLLHPDGGRVGSLLQLGEVQRLLNQRIDAEISGVHVGSLICTAICRALFS